jgi:tripartite-type tricarboxylate transporter receptor subunit TctC
MSLTIDRRWRTLKQALVAGAASLLLAACSNAAAPAQKTAPTSAPSAAKPAGGVDLTGKTVRLVVGYAPGGGFDSTARLLTPYLQQALPGNPTIVVENMPGADSLVAAKTILAGPVRPDDINIVVMISTMLSKSSLAGGLDGFAVEKEAAYLGKPDSYPTILALCAQKKSVKNLEEFMALKKPLKVAALTGGSLYDVLLKWTKEVGFPIDIVSGYAGTAQMVLAFNQGEVEGVAACRDVDLAQNSDWLEKDLITPLFYWHESPATLKKLAAEGRFPWFKQALEAKQVTADQKAVLENVNATNRGSNVYAMHKQTPAPLLETVRAAMKQAVSNPAFVADMEKRQLNAGYMSPDEIDANVKALEKFTPEGRDLMKRLLGV